MNIPNTARSSLLALAVLAAGCTPNQDRSDAGTGAQDNRALQTPAAGNGDALRKELDTAKADRDRYKAQLAEANKAADELKTQLREATTQNETAQARLKSVTEELAKATSELEAAKKSQGDTETMNARLKAAEDGVTAARAKAAEADRAAAAAVDAANKAKEQASQLATERAALQEKVNALTAELVKKSSATPPAVPDLNK